METSVTSKAWTHNGLAKKALYPYRRLCKAPMVNGVRRTGKTVRAMTAALMLTMSTVVPAGLAEASPVQMVPGTGGGSALSTVAPALPGYHRPSVVMGNAAEDVSKLLAEELLAEAVQAEPAVTADMKRLVKKGARLKGLEHRIKSVDSLNRKILSTSAEENVSLVTAASEISDVLRYTVIVPEHRYTRAVPQSIQQLMDEGYRLEKFRNAWGGIFYQGVNLHLTSPAGVRLEVQFHTPQSFAVKQESHAVYEIRRNPASSPDEVADAVAESIAFNARVRVPAGAETIDFSASA